jgi:adenylosuccinate lyase
MIARYTRPQMGRLFTDKYKFEAWLKVELAVCAAWAERGEIPNAAYQRIKKKARFRLKRIEEVEAKVHHDVIAFNTAVADYIGDDSAYFHRGLTSSDVVDTAQNLVLKEAGRLLEVGLGKLKYAMGVQALKYRHTPVIGRTHGVHAEPTTFGLKLLVIYDELARQEERLAAAIDGISVGKLSGAVGNFANIPLSIEELVLRKLGLQPAPVSNQVVQRDRHAAFICTLAGIGATLEKLSVQLRTGQRTEIGEVQEPFAAGQKGSSAMPHKKNPILLERVAGLARVLRGYAVTALENVALWDERDISHSGAERVIFPDACILVDYMLAKMLGIVENLVVHEEQMRHNIHLTHGLVFSQRVLLKLAAAGISREDAYDIVQRNAMQCWEDGTPLLEALTHDNDVRAVLSAAEINALFSLEPYLAHVDEIFGRVGLLKRERRIEPRGREGTGGGAAADDKAKMPQQNIEERPSDWYESSTIITEGRDKADETLGEADHQKRPARRTATRRRPKAKPAPPAKSAKKPTSKAKAKPAGDAKPATDASAQGTDSTAAKPAAGDAAPEKKKRRRGTRGGRRRKKTTSVDSVAPSHTDNDDDTYVD